MEVGTPGARGLQVTGAQVSPGSREHPQPRLEVRWPRWWPGGREAACPPAQLCSGSQGVTRGWPPALRWAWHWDRGPWPQMCGMGMRLTQTQRIATRNRDPDAPPPCLSGFQRGTSPRPAAPPYATERSGEAPLHPSVPLPGAAVLTRRCLPNKEPVMLPVGWAARLQVGRERPALPL